MKQVTKKIKLGGRTLTLSAGALAQQADSAVLAQYGETVVLATVVSAPLKEDLGYFPLFVEYQQRLYAGGRIKGSRWVKREGRPSDDDILIARLIDRSIRPLFPKNYKKEVQVIVTVLSVDLENNPDTISAIAVSAALSASRIPWSGPVGVIKVGMKDGSYVTNPTDSEVAKSELELVVSATRDAIVMIEAGAREVSENEMSGAIKHAEKEAKALVLEIEKFAQEVGVEKEVLLKEKKDKTFDKKVKELAGENVKDLIAKMATKEAGYFELDEAKRALFEALPDERKDKVAGVFDNLFQEEVRKMILSGKRPDGRKSDELRKLSAQVSILPRTHGSGLFQRGQTQALSIATLGSPAMEQLIETAEGEESKRYIHHYSMPPYSTGETGRIGSPSRREIGHGALAEKALEPVIPPADKFPYTIRVVSEVMSSNGSTSMASVCGSTLSLMDAGVPISAPVSGIAMGLIVESKDKYVILSDITGLEDGSGDMDFKVAGTEKGITALQLDVKTLSLTPSILEKALGQAKEARLEIMKVIKKAIAGPRETLSQYAPKIKMIKIPVDKIGEIIGPGGRNIRALMAETETQIDVDDAGVVNITGANKEGVDSALARVEAIIKEVEPGEIYEGTVKRIQPFGAFVEVLPGKEGLVHVSDMSTEFVKDPNDLLKLGDKVQVRVKEIDDLGRINLSMNMDPEADKKREPRRVGFQGKGERRGGGYQGGRRGGGGFQRRERSSGPHFPTSRLLSEDRSKKKY